MTKQYAELCKQSRVTIVTRDRWGKEWVQSTWRGTGCAYVQSSLAKSDIYLEVIPLFFRGRIRLPDHPKLLRKLRLLHLQRHGGGRQSIDHPRGDHDDFANAVCGVLRGLSDHYGYRLDVFDPNFRDEDAPPQPARQGPELSDVPLYNGDMAAYFSTADIC